MRITGTFVATDNSGNEYTINVLQREHDTSTEWDPRTMAADDLKELWTDDGRAVNFVATGVYDIISGAKMIRITSSDPDAP
jgi:hypothetical protein